MSLLGKGLVGLGRARYAQRLWKASWNARGEQESALRRLLKQAENTAFGRAHGFDKIRTVADFRTQVPLHRYQDLEPWFRRAMGGEPNVVWPGLVPYFGMTSGTTAGNKYLPISSDTVRQQQRGGFEPLASYLTWTHDAELLDAKGLVLASSSDLEMRAPGIQIGDNTGIMASHVPFWVHSKYLPSPEVRRVRDWDEKMKRVAAESWNADVRLLVGTPAWFPALFDAVFAAAEQAGRKLEHVTDAWPNLRLLTGGGVDYEPYRKLIEQRLGRALPYVQTYSATEGGIMGIADQPSDPALLLLPDNGVFYEFVALSEIDSPKPRRSSLWEVEQDVPYVIHVSTMSGIWSYAIGDCVRFVERFPHRFHFEGRVQAFVNVQGEHVSQSELERAVRLGCQRLDVSTVDFTLWPEVGLDGGSAARHVFFVEFDGAVPDLEAFAREVDKDLAQGNGDYVTHRQTSFGLLMPVVRALPRGTFHEWMKQRGKLGGQNKVPRLITNAEALATLESVARQLSHSRGNGASNVHPSQSTTSRGGALL